jgi:tetratricopeptide (TPR) repeat protein
MPDLDALWDFDDPAASGGRFRAAIDAAEAAGDAALADEARTQLARSLGLLARFEDGDQVLDTVDAAHAGADRVRIRSRLERGRLRRSSGDTASAAAPFEEAWALARQLGEDGLAVDAAHMLALVDAAPGLRTWNERALELASTSPDPAARGWRGSLWNNIGWERFEAGELEGALAAFGTALEARREQGRAKETQVAEWCVARCLRALGRVEEGLEIQLRLAAAAAAGGMDEDGYVSEEAGECLLALGRPGEARPHFRRSAELLGADAWLAEHEPERIARLRELGGG